MKKYALIAAGVLAVLMIAMPVFAAGTVHEDFQKSLLEATSYDDQLAQIAQFSSQYTAELEGIGGWGTDLNVPFASDVPQDLPKEIFQNAQNCDQLPRDMLSARWTAIYSDQGEMRLAGNYLARLPVGCIATSEKEIECVLYIRHTRRAIQYTIGYGYGQEYAVYAFRADGQGIVYKLYGAYNPPPMAGISGQISGELITDESLFEGIRQFFAEQKLWNAGDGVTLSFSVTGASCLLNGYEGTPVILTVPDSVEGYTVTGIAPDAFRECESITSVRLPDSINWIGDYAFFSCSALEELNMPHSLKTVGASAFGGSALKKVIFPEGLTSIGKYAINTTDQLEELSLPDTLNEMGEGNLEFGSRLLRIVIPESLNVIGDFFLFSVDSVRCVFIPGGTQLVGNNTLCQAGELTVYTPKDSPAWNRAIEIGYRTVDCSSSNDMPDAWYETDGDFQYIVFDGKAYATGYFGSNSKLDIPATLGGYPVKALCYRFTYPKSVTDITVEEGISVIEPYALASRYEGSGMTVHLPASIQKIYPDGISIFHKMQPITVCAPEGSAAQQFVLELGDANITYRRSN